MPLSLSRLALLALFGWAPPADPDALVADLAAPHKAAHDEAAGALEEIGRPALPSLYKARGVHDDPDARARVDRLIDLIERQRLLRATRVALDFDDRPLAEVAEAIRDRSGFPVVLDAGVAVVGRRVTLRAAEPVAFWEALDRLGAAAGVRHDPGAADPDGRPGPVVKLVAAEGPPPPSDSAGPFRVVLVRVGRHREVVRAAPPGKPKVVDEFSADLQVFAEPGLATNYHGPPVLEQATDDLGHDLDPRGPGGPTRRTPWPPRFDQGEPFVLQYRIPLRRPEGPGRRVKTLKGYVPLTVVARTGGPAVVPLNAPEGEAFRAGGVSLSVSGVERRGQTTSFILTVRGATDGPAPASAGPTPPGDYRPPYRVEDHLQVVDDRGRACWWSPGAATRGPSGGTTYRIEVQSRGAGPPAELRYHGLVGAAAEAVFEFHDLPAP